MSFRNRIRLPLYLKTPQFPTEANRFRLSNGESKTLSVTIRKTYALETDYMIDGLHEKLVIALNHDDVTIEGDRYAGGVSVEAEYEIPPVDFLDYPVRKASTVVQVTPFDMTNDNCQTCDEATQLALVDDDAGDMDPGGSDEVNVYANDSICCFPVEAEITYVNTDYLASATINSNTGVVTLTAKDPVSDVGSIVMATYRVTCPDGSYDEADVYGSISGGSTACEQPGNFDPVEISAPPAPYDVTISWGSPVSPPAGGYEWQLYRSDTPGTPILTGTETGNSASFQVPESGTSYSFYVRSVCEEGLFSPYSEVIFITPAEEMGRCSEYLVSCNDGTLGSNAYNYSYMDCSGIIQNRILINLQSRTHCMFSDIFDQPLYFASDPSINITFIGQC